MTNEPTPLQKAVETPRTDAVVWSHCEDGPFITDHHIALAEFARTLERESLYATKQLESMTEANKLLLLKLRDVVAEKDTKFKALQKENEELKRTIENVNKGKAHLMDLIDERDAFKLLLKQCGEALQGINEMNDNYFSREELVCDRDRELYDLLHKALSNPLLTQIMSEKE